MQVIYRVNWPSCCRCWGNKLYSTVKVQLMDLDVEQIIVSCKSHSIPHLTVRTSVHCKSNITQIVACHLTMSIYAWNKIILSYLIYTCIWSALCVNSDVPTRMCQLGCANSDAKTRIIYCFLIQLRTNQISTKIRNHTSELTKNKLIVMIYFNSFDKLVFEG